MGPDAGRNSEPMLDSLLGPLEALVMRIVIARGPVNVADVAEAAAATRGTAPAYTTIMTVLVRLHEKGLLERERSGRQYLYASPRQERELIEMLSERAVDRLLLRYGNAALRQFAERLANLDADTRTTLLKLAEERRHGRDA